MLKVYLGRMPICWRWRLSRSSCWPSTSKSSWKQLVSMPPKSTTWKLFCQTSERKIRVVFVFVDGHIKTILSLSEDVGIGVGGFFVQICFVVKTKSGKTHQHCQFFSVPSIDWSLLTFVRFNSVKCHRRWFLPFWVNFSWTVFSNGQQTQKKKQEEEGRSSFVGKLIWGRLKKLRLQFCLGGS